MVPVTADPSIPTTLTVTSPTVTFDFDWPWWDADDVIVRVDGVVVDPANYAVDGSGDGGVVTLNSSVDDVTVEIDRLVRTDLTAGLSVTGQLDIPALNSQLARITARDQDIQRLIEALDPTVVNITVDGSTSRTMTPLDFNCAGDGSTDDTTNFNLGSAYCDLHDLIYDGLGKSYKVTSVATLAKKSRNITLLGAGVTASQTTATGLSQVAIAKCVGTDIWSSPSTTSPTGAVSRFDTTMVVGSVTVPALAAGDTILLHEAAAWNAADITVCQKSEVLVIKSVDVPGKTLTFMGRVKGNYTTAATIRKYGGETAQLDNIIIVGGGGSLAQVGLSCANLTRLDFGRVEVRSCQNVGFGAYNCAEVTGRLVRGFSINSTGLGYCFQYSGSSNVSVDAVIAYDCRHGTTAGGGASGHQLARVIQFGRVIGVGMMDALVDEHPGVVGSQYGEVVGSANPALSTNDGMMIQGGGSFQVGRVNLFGFKGRGLGIQYYGHGDGDTPVFHVGSLISHQPTGGTTFGFTFEDSPTSASPGTWPIGSITAHIDTRSDDGSRVQTQYQPVGDVTITGRAEALNSAANGFLLRCERGVTGRALIDMHSKTPTGGVGEAMHILGASGYEFEVNLGRSLIEGGTTGLQITYANADTRDARIEGYGTNRIVLSTNGTVAQVRSVTISGGVVAVPAGCSLLLVDTEGAAASDDLDSVTGLRSGQRLTICAANSARTVVVKDGTFFKLAGDATLDDDVDTVTVIGTATGTAARETGRSGNA